MTNFQVTHRRPLPGRRDALVVGAWTVVAPTWKKAVEEAHRELPLTDGDFLSWS